MGDAANLVGVEAPGGRSHSAMVVWRDISSSEDDEDEPLGDLKLHLLLRSKMV